MFITKTLALPRLDESDHLKIDNIKKDEHSPVLDTLREIMWQDDFDISDDEFLAHMCVRAGLFSHRDWQELINRTLATVCHIDYEVDSKKRRLTLEETVYQMGGLSGRVSGGGYKMISALSARSLVFENVDAFSRAFGKEPREFIEDVWRELDGYLKGKIISGEYTFELHDLKHADYRESKNNT